MLTYTVSRKLLPNQLRHIRTYIFELKLDEAIEFRLQNENELFQETTMFQLGEKILRAIPNLNFNAQTRLSTADCRTIFEKIRDDPALQTLAEQLTIDQYHRLEPLISTITTSSTLKVVLSLHA